MENPNKTTAFGILLLLFFTIPTSIRLSNSVFMYHIPEITLFIIILYGIYISFKDVYLVIDYKNNKIYQENIFKFIKIKKYYLDINEIEKICLSYNRLPNKIDITSDLKVTSNLEYHNKFYKLINGSVESLTDILFITKYRETYNFSIESDNSENPVNETFAPIIAIALKKEYIPNPDKCKVVVNPLSEKNYIRFIHLTDINNPVFNREELNEPSVSTEFGTVIIIFGTIFIIFICYLIFKSQMNY
jgi:hypothetical protein